MIIKNPALLKKFLFVVKIVITIVSIIYIIRKIISENIIHNIFYNIQLIKEDHFKLGIIFFVFTAMIVNWLVEAYKWKFLISKLEHISLGKSLKSVLIGLSIGIVTPSRIGEFSGKVFILDKADRKSAFIISMISSFSQFFATIFFGFFGLIYFVHRFKIIDNQFVIVLLVSMTIILFLLIFLIYNISYFENRTINNTLMKRGVKYFQIFFSFKTKEVFRALFLSCIRFVIFTTQFWALFFLFDISLNFTEAFLLISLSYLILTIVPTIALADIGIRGTIVLYFIGFISANQSGILSASILLWFINLAFPAFIGAFFIYQLKLFRNK
ncbi:MAG: lysylphosphatidylglycerol synthase domain-containing protein [Bacteroidota bacterium]